MHKQAGSVRMVDSVAYVAQQAWIQNATLRDNITFGKDLMWSKYQDIVRFTCVPPMHPCVTVCVVPCRCLHVHSTRT